MILHFVTTKKEIPKNAKFIGKAKPYGKLRIFVRFINSALLERKNTRIYFVLYDFSIGGVKAKRKVLREVIPLTIFEPEDRVISVVKFIQKTIKERNIPLEKICFDLEELCVFEFL